MRALRGRTVSLQPPVGIWKTSPGRRLWWALEQVLYETIEKADAYTVETWQLKIAAAMKKPVIAFNWEGWWLQLRKDDSNQPPVDAMTGWDAIVTSITDDLWPQAGKARATALELPFDEDDLMEALNGSLKLVTGITDTSRAQLRQLMEKAYDEQTTQFGFARQIRAEFPDIAKARAERIAVTEWNRAASAATQLGLVAQGVAQKIWLTVGDSRVCPTCESNAADGEIPISSEFYSGDQYPPGHTSCRCSLASA